MCAPSARPVSAFGALHDAHAPASSWHSKTAPEVAVENAIDAAVLVTCAAGAVVIVVSGNAA